MRMRRLRLKPPSPAGVPIFVSLQAFALSPSLARSLARSPDERKKTQDYGVLDDEVDEVMACRLMRLMRLSCVG